MLVNKLEVPAGTRLSFQARMGPLTHQDAFFDLGRVMRAEQHADAAVDLPERLENHRMVLECQGVEASELAKQLNWPKGETLLPGIVKFGSHEYPAELQIRARPKGLRAILRSIE
jgi:hypothetical protein